MEGPISLHLCTVNHGQMTENRMDNKDHSNCQKFKRVLFLQTVTRRPVRCSLLNVEAHRRLPNQPKQCSALNYASERRDQKLCDLQS